MNEKEAEAVLRLKGFERDEWRKSRVRGSNQMGDRLFRKSGLKLPSKKIGRHWSGIRHESSLFGSVGLLSGLGLIGAAVFGGNDKETFIAPPEATVEGFVRIVLAGRYSRATPDLSPRASNQVSEAELRELR